MRKAETDLMICETLDGYMNELLEWNRSKDSLHPNESTLFQRYQLLVAVAAIEKENE